MAPAGIYLDSDAVIMKPLDALRGYEFAMGRDYYKEKQKLNNGTVHYTTRYLTGRFAAQRGFHPTRNPSIKCHRRGNGTAGGTLNQPVIGFLLG